MSFANTEKWKRHVVEIALVGNSVVIRCMRCKIDLPSSCHGGQIVCSRYDRLFLKDHEKAVDCAV